MNGILSSALTSLQTNSAALRVVANNVANLNTQGYARRTVEQQALTVGGQVAGVQISDVQRVVDKFLNLEQLAASASSAQYSAQTDIYDQLNAMLGEPGDGTSLTSRLDNVFSAFSQAALSPTSNASRQGILNSFQTLASTITTLSSTVSNLRMQVDQQVTSSVDQVNALVKQIYSLNSTIAQQTAVGNTASGLLDQRDTALTSLSQLIGIRTNEQADGRVNVMTTDGVNLVSDMYAQLSYSGGGLNGDYAPVMIQNVNPNSGAVIGNTLPLNEHMSSGKLKGLLDMRDGSLAALQGEIGNFAQQTALAFNAQHNANSAFPPPATMQGRNTGLLGTDSLNFTGKTTLAVADQSGALVSRIDVDFDAGTLTVDGGGPVGFSGDVGSFVSALNTALDVNGTADFSNGVLTLTAASGNGLVVQDDATTPSSRGGTGFSQFFGLNDLLQSAAPSISATGISGTDDAGLAAGGAITFALRGPNGETARQASVTVTAGMTVDDVITALNTAMNGSASFTLGTDGKLSMALSPSTTGYQLNVTNDTTVRGTTGMSFSQLFGMGTQQLYAQSQNFQVNPAVVREPGRIALAQASITPTTGAGETIVAGGDTRGLIALQNVSDTRRTFGAIGTLGTQTATLNDYAAAFYQDVATRSSTATANQQAQADRLTEATARQQSVSGVNLDEELSNMMLYQQAYAAGARMLQTVNSLFDTLFQIQ
jgi:flagellar hook-associated protein 1 FlgK